MDKRFMNQGVISDAQEGDIFKNDTEHECYLTQVEAETRVMIGLYPEKLIELMRMGVLSGADIQVRDADTKKLVQQVCLSSCSEKVCADCTFSDVCGVTSSAEGTRECRMPQPVHWRSS